MLHQIGCGGCFVHCRFLKVWWSELCQQLWLLLSILPWKQANVWHTHNPWSRQPILGIADTRVSINCREERQRLNTARSCQRRETALIKSAAFHKVSVNRMRYCMVLINWVYYTFLLSVFTDEWSLMDDPAPEWKTQHPIYEKAKNKYKAHTSWKHYSSVPFLH